MLGFPTNRDTQRYCTERLSMWNWTKNLFYQLAIIPLFLFLFSGYSHQPEVGGQQEGFALAEIPPYARHLKGFTICLDAGHGGQGHIPDYKRGPTGLREAEANLQVAFYLRERLQQVGATVIMTRVDDSYVSLSRRSQIANESRADFFISLHHNSISTPETNYTSTWYHGDADESRTSLDLARYVQQGVADALCLPTAPATGLYSDKLIVSSGFSVLRLAECPAIVCEASFYSNPQEEARLRTVEYLKREANGYFLGIARYVAGGFPKGALIKPQHEAVIRIKTPKIQISVADGLHERGAWMLKRQQVFTDSIRVKIDNVNVPFHYRRGEALIDVFIEKPLTNGIHFVETGLVNYYGNHSLPSAQWFKVAPPAASLKLNATTQNLPFDGKSYVRVTAKVFDAEGMPIADGEPIHATTSMGRIVTATAFSQRDQPSDKLAETVEFSQNGTAHFYVHAPTQPGKATVQAGYRQKHESLTIHFEDIEGAIVQGHLSDADTGQPIPNAQLHAEPALTAVTDTDGHFFIMTEFQGDVTFHFTAPRYYPQKRQFCVRQNGATVIHAKLQVIADGVFAENVFVLDVQKEAPATVQLIETLEQMLKLAGAKVYQVQQSGQKLSLKDRIANVNAIPEEGYYFRFHHTPWEKNESAVIASHYHGNRTAETLLKQILKQFNDTLFETAIETVQDKTTPEIQHTNKMAMTLEIRSLNHANTSPIQEAFAIFSGVWQALKTDTQLDAGKQKRFLEYFHQTK